MVFFNSLWLYGSFALLIYGMAFRQPAITGERGSQDMADDVRFGFMRRFAHEPARPLPAIGFSMCRATRRIRPGCAG